MGIAAAVAGAAVVGAGASIYSSSKASSAATKAASSNNALQSQIYAQNQQALSPYEQTGNAAGTAINSLLGLGGTPNYAGYVQDNPDLLAAYNASGKGQSMAQWGQDHWNTNGQYEGRTVTPTSTESGGSTASAAQSSAFNNYLNSTGYQFQLNQGLKSTEAALGAKGLLDSGAAAKSLNNYAQNQALTGFNSYLGALQGQQQTGLSAASAQAGVGQNYANSVSANNNAAATATGNAALSGASSVNGALGSALTAYGYSQGLGSSYGGGSQYNGAINSYFGGD